MTAPNSHSLVFTLQRSWINKGKPYRDQNIHRTYNTVEEAKAAGDAEMAADPEHCLGYEVHSYFDEFADKPPQFRDINIRPTQSISDMDDGDPTAL